MIPTTPLLVLLSLLQAKRTLSAQLSNSASISIPPNLKPWLITSLGGGTPSGRSGNPPYSTLRILISDPNTIPLAPTHYSEMSYFHPSNATCYVKWNSYNGEDPFDAGRIPCWAGDTFTAGRWSMRLERQNVTGWGASATRDFRAVFELEESMILDEGVVTMRFEGARGFAVGQELQLVCGASGVCSTGLKNEMGVVEVKQEGSLEGWNWN